VALYLTIITSNREIRFILPEPGSTKSDTGKPGGLFPGDRRRRWHSGICKDVRINPEFSNTIWDRTSADLKAS
jgi:hypothetical protein